MRVLLIRLELCLTSPIPPPSEPALAGSTAATSRVPGTLAPRKLSLHFTGSATEYFRIWIVNTCLTLFSLGVYSAWAKVRKKHYFYSHTVLDGTPFQYLGQPIPILKGRLIATALFITWYVATHYITALLPFVLILAFVLAPWSGAQLECHARPVPRRRLALWLWAARSDRCGAPQSRLTVC